MKVDIKKLHEQIAEMSLGDLCLLCGQALNMNMSKARTDVLLQYLDIALVKRKLESPTSEGEKGEHEPKN